MKKLVFLFLILSTSSCFSQKKLEHINALKLKKNLQILEYTPSAFVLNKEKKHPILDLLNETIKQIRANSNSKKDE